MQGGRRSSRSSPWPLRAALVTCFALFVIIGKGGMGIQNDGATQSRATKAHRRQGLEYPKIGQHFIAGTTSTNQQQRSSMKAAYNTIDQSFRMPIVADDIQEDGVTISKSGKDNTQQQKSLYPAKTSTTVTENEPTNDDDDDDDVLDERSLELQDPLEQELELSNAEAEALTDISAVYNQTLLEQAVKSAEHAIATTKPFNPSRFPKDMNFTAALATCETLECVHDAHYQPRDGPRFNFPDFFIIGWQKTATTSLYSHFSRHVGVMQSSAKEPEVLTQDCNFNLRNCTEKVQRDYIKRILHRDRFVEADATQPVFEASTHIVRGEDDLEIFAAQMKEFFPWAKLIASIREPISRAMSMLFHLKDKGIAGCLNRMSMAKCLLKNSQISVELYNPVIPTNYSYPLATWLSTWPREQFFLMQYEELTSEYEEAVLRGTKLFLGVDPDLPRRSGLPLTNARKHKTADGWAMTKQEYLDIIALVKPDVDALMNMVETYKLGNATRWRENWERVWQDNLDTCDDSGNCMIQLS